MTTIERLLAREHSPVRLVIVSCAVGMSLSAAVHGIALLLWWMM